VADKVEFTDRYPGVRTSTITINRPSRPHIVAAAASFARSIPGRLDKEMSAFRPSAPRSAEPRGPGVSSGTVTDLFDYGTMSDILRVTRNGSNLPYGEEYWQC
jgi:hypothetical protein